MGWQEDDVVHALAERWRPVSTVVVAGGNRGAVSFLTSEDRRKSPDVVIYVEGAVVVVEAKARGAGLFAGGAESDAELLSALLGDQVRAGGFLDRVRGILGSKGIDLPDEIELVGGLLAGSRFSAGQVKVAAGLCCIAADEKGRVAAVARADLLPDALADALD